MESFNLSVAPADSTFTFAACLLSVSAFFQRRLMKALEDLCVHYDNSVRTSEQTIVQFTYGDDGLDPVMMVQGGMPVHFARLLEQCRAVPSTGPNVSPMDIVDLQAVLDTPYFTATCSHHFVQRMKDFIKTYIIDLETALQALNLLPGAPRNPECELSEEDAQMVFDRTRRLTAEQFNNFLEACRRKYVKAVMEPGTAVGALGAQSIGEPGTQMTLKTVRTRTQITMTPATA